MKLHYAIVYLYPSPLYSYTPVALHTNTDLHTAGMLCRAFSPQHRRWFEPTRAPCRGLPEDFSDVGEHAGRGRGRLTSLDRTGAPTAAGLRGWPCMQIVRGATGRATGASEQVLYRGDAVWRRRARSEGALRRHCVRAEGLALRLVALRHPGLSPR